MYQKIEFPNPLGTHIVRSQVQHPVHNSSLGVYHAARQRASLNAKLLLQVLTGNSLLPWFMVPSTFFPFFLLFLNLFKLNLFF